MTVSRDLRDIKHTNICIIGIPEEEKYSHFI